MDEADVAAVLGDGGDERGVRGDGRRRDGAGRQEGIVQRVDDERGHAHAADPRGAARAPVVVVDVLEAVQRRGRRVVEFEEGPRRERTLHVDPPSEQFALGGDLRA